MNGILFGAGVGPGDPELITLKTVRLIRENPVMAFPGPVPEETVAYRIAVQAVPELKDKELLPVPMPMTKDRQEMEESHRRGARILEETLKTGKNVVFLTLGDPSVYSTFFYLQRIVQSHGFQTETAAGVPSFCAAAAALQTPLAEWNQTLHVIPALHGVSLSEPGNYVLMKSGRRMDPIKELLKDTGREVYMVENCGMPEEKIYAGLEELPEKGGYYSLIIAKERGEKS